MKGFRTLLLAAALCAAWGGVFLLWEWDNPWVFHLGGVANRLLFILKSGRFQHAVEPYPPAYFWVVRLFFDVCGRADLRILRVLNVLWVGVAGLCLLVPARALWPGRFWPPVAVALFLLAPVHGPVVNSIQTMEVSLAPFLFLFYGGLLRAGGGGKTGPLALSAGALSAGMLFKDTLWLFAAGGAVAWLVSGRPWSLGRAGRRIVFAAACAGLPLALQRVLDVPFLWDRIHQHQALIDWTSGWSLAACPAIVAGNLWSWVRNVALFDPFMALLHGLALASFLPWRASGRIRPLQAGWLAGVAALLPVQAGGLKIAFYYALTGLVVLCAVHTLARLLDGRGAAARAGVAAVLVACSLATLGVLRARPELWSPGVCDVFSYRDLLACFADAGAGSAVRAVENSLDMPGDEIVLLNGLDPDGKTFRVRLDLDLDPAAVAGRIRPGGPAYLVVSPRSQAPETCRFRGKIMDSVVYRVMDPAGEAGG